VNLIPAEQISTRRLTLVPIAVGHADEMARVLADPVLYTFIGGTAPSRDDLRARYERWIAGSPDPDESFCNWVIEVSEPGADASRLAGTVQATITEAPPEAAGRSGAVRDREAEIAWVIGTGWQGRGYASEAARALVTWLERQSVTTVVAHIRPDHRASAAVATAAGLSPTDQEQDGEIRWRLQLPR
jgi:RimJ/RimL family protein N-acetyltransferase